MYHVDCESNKSKEDGCKQASERACDTHCTFSTPRHNWQSCHQVPVPTPNKNPNRNTITLWQKLHSICHFSPAASKGGRLSTLLIAEIQGDPCFFYSNRKQKNLKLGAQLTWCCQKLCQFRLRLYHWAWCRSLQGNPAAIEIGILDLQLQQ